MARLILIGLPGVGKSSVARALATRWGCEFLDTDDLIAQSVAMSAPEYLREFGEMHFREREFDALCRAIDSTAVVATGAGIVTRQAARELIAEYSAIWLDADDATLLERVAIGERPLLGSDHAESLRRLRSQREGWYRACARTRLDASGSIDEVVERVVSVCEDVRP
ncbi:MAG TPA: shikimate kinase [Acidimicrobiales bacterium]|nr:shikimate kinase [Acidimicrobiales bacterium]